MWEYIQSTCSQMEDLERRVRLAKGNVENITAIMSTWNESPLYQRKEDKNTCLLNLDVSFIFHSSVEF